MIRTNGRADYPTTLRYMMANSTLLWIAKHEFDMLLKIIFTDLIFVFSHISIVKYLAVS